MALDLSHLSPGRVAFPAKFPKNGAKADMTRVLSRSRDMCEWIDFGSSAKRVRAMLSVAHLARQLVEGCHEARARSAVGAAGVAWDTLGDRHNLNPWSTVRSRYRAGRSDGPLLQPRQT